ncbi:FAD-dependent oxidoreductase [Micromonospora sp. IBSANI012]|uniref:FAD-dependent oxidoreductase n=1 Tax=Micromonospora sp. IBSANI012 TaxID=3457761 RepID=UPI0040589424
MAQRLIVIGGDAAGMAAASQARRRRRRRDDLEILAFERGHFTSYSACGIPYWISGIVEDRDDLIVRSPATFREEHQIDVRVRTEVTGIDLDRREVVARDLDRGGEVRERFDTLVYATGAVPTKPDWARDDVGGVFGVQTLDDGAAVRDWLDAEPKPRRAVVVGGGYIGVEMAEALVQRGLSVTLVEQGEQPMSTVDPDMAALVATAMRGLGIEIRTGVRVTGIEERDGRVAAVVTDAGSMPTDLVVLGLGVRPNTALAAAAGLPVGTTGGVRVDRRMRVPGMPDVWAAGDCVETLHRVSGMAVHVPLGTHANKQGRVVGINIGGGYATFPGVIGTAVTKVCDLEVGRTGLREREAASAGFEFVTVRAESTSRAGYYPGTRPMTVKLIAERPTGRLLGAQIVGRSEAAKRIDALAVALWNGMTVDDMTALDLGYAPPYAPVWDPVLIAARKAVDALAG